ncbi:hypothetical protein BS47DRAFT_1344362 [Hydnum rufescens UP504]|uniref:Metal homeostatis protein bsd2 n=1 Tax=Hydnum rufescens UP504 TaxID=1448309 RepID=A0A9P6DWZ7_9AGAM|nr:hypothetical protein BS47DRAFT_1344362 [Hydnum rufescens UP504]
MARYTQLPTQTSEEEMEAAFENSDSDDEADDVHNTSSRPLLADHNRSPSHPLDSINDQDTPSRTSPSNSGSGAYDFEYDYAMLPPPGSPPQPSALALPNAYGNSNGLIPSSSSISTVRRPGIIQRALGAILPTHYAHDRRGGGLGNDGVFVNVVAKPGGTAPVRGAADSEGPYWVPEESQKESPPWSAGWDMIIDSLPVGSVFAFLWNLLVSVSFQFVGFLLTYLLHTTHASKYGSRAGLGITLIQYGFYMRSPEATVPVAGDDGADPWGGWSQVMGASGSSEANSTPAARALPKLAHALFHRAVAAAPPPAQTLPNSTVHDLSEASPAFMIGGSFTTNDWMSFLLMTLGWFILITSFLGFWRVKQWERGVQRSVMTEREPTPEELMRDAQTIRHIQHADSRRVYNWRI